MISLWRYNYITGYWQFIRKCEEDTAFTWLAIFQNDSPNDVFKLSKVKPQNKLKNMLTRSFNS